MKLSASLQASANVPFELEYAEKRLEHYRGIVESGKLKALLETGKKNKADWFQVDHDSVLGNYLLHGPNKTQAQAHQDKTRMSAYPYNWKVFDKNTAVKCPACGKTQPWCESLDGEGVGLKAFALGFVVCFLGLIPLMAGVRLQGAQVALALLPIAAWIVVSIISYKLMRKKQLARLAALPWNADDLPRFDEDFLARAKAQYSQSRKMA